MEKKLTDSLRSAVVVAEVALAECVASPSRTYMLLGVGRDPGLAALAKFDGDCRIGYFGERYVWGTSVYVNHLVCLWNRKHGNSEHQASCVASQEAAEWMQRNIAVLKLARERAEELEGAAK